MLQDLAGGCGGSAAQGTPRELKFASKWLSPTPGRKWGWHLPAAAHQQGHCCQSTAGQSSPFITHGLAVFLLFFPISVSLFDAPDSAKPRVFKHLEEIRWPLRAPPGPSHQPHITNVPFPSPQHPAPTHALERVLVELKIPSPQPSQWLRTSLEALFHHLLLKTDPLQTLLFLSLLLWLAFLSLPNE